LRIRYSNSNVAEVFAQAFFEKAWQLTALQLKEIAQTYRQKFRKGFLTLEEKNYYLYSGVPEVNLLDSFMKLIVHGFKALGFKTLNDYNP